METILKILEKLMSAKNGFKILAWIFIFLILLAIILYPIIDANFLYYNRTNQRIELIQKIASIDENEIKKDKRIEEEYNKILNDMSSQDDNYMSNIIQKETNKRNNIAKFVSGAWLFGLVGMIMPFTKDKDTGKRFSANNFWALIVCFAIAGILGYICYKIPNIINLTVNIVLYQFILVFLAYTIATSGKK